MMAYLTLLLIVSGVRICIMVMHACLTSFLYLLQGKRKYLDTLHKYLEIHGTFFGVKVVVLLLSSIYYSKQQTNKEMTANKTNKFDCAIGPDPERTVSIK